MENYIVSARKYRPATFDTVVGQKSITNTLKNAIKNNHLAQSFLFCGPRGIGKTTCARIFAKTINCENISDTIEPCNKCKSCESFKTSNSFNVHELDAASNNTVDNIRSLIEQVRVPPQIGKYKIYIIDEVHMLSQQAFNAFLKTLEEPPDYAKFILATTEKNKIIPTILSRCQIFDFKRINADDMAKHLQYVAEKENVSAESEALHLIAQKADGALRDALSIFDQIVSFTGTNVTYRDVINILNILDYDYFFKITDYILEENATEILLLINEIIEKGFEGSSFILGYGQHLRNLLVSKNSKTLSLLETSKSIKQKYQKQSEKCSEEFIINALEILSECDTNYKQASNKKLLLELTLIRMGAHQKKKHIQQQDTENSTLISPTKEASTINPDTKKADSEKKEYSTENNHPAQKAEEPKKDKTPYSHNSNIRLKKPIKINNPNNEVKTETENTDCTDKPEKNEFQNKEICVEEFYKCWNQMADNLKDESHSLFIAFTKNKPTLIDKNHIEILVDNMVQESEIKEKKTKILNFLRKKLNNRSITLSIRITPKDKVKQKAYLPEEKFKLLTDKNPNILTLKDKLSLDFY